MKNLVIYFILGLVFGSWEATVDAAPLPVISSGRTPTGLLLQMQKGALQLQVCGDRTIHVLYRPDGKIPEQPVGLAVQKEPAPGGFQQTENSESVGLKTGRFSVQVNKQTGALSFFGSDNKAFLQEETDAGKMITPSTVAGVATNTIDQQFIRDPAEGLYGLGQHPAAGMNYAGTIHLQQVNQDVAVPVLLSSKGYGIFWNNPSITDVTMSKSSDPKPTVDWRSECGDMIDYYVFYGPSPDQVIADYRELTGAAPLFGRWAWGFWQCKEHYATQQELLDVVARYRAMKVPLDGIIQDWYYWAPHPWGSHMFDAGRYPDPAGLTAKLHAENVHILISVWAKFDPGSENFDALKKGGDLLEQNGSPNPFRFYDPFKADARTLYWNQISTELFVDGFDGWWLDASEPELNGQWGEFRNINTAAGIGSKVFNSYPLLHTTAVYNGQRAENSQKRVFILTRSAYAGQQRNAAVTWSGDVYGNWDVFAKQIPAGINFCYSGIPYWNTDIGGFISQNPTDPAYAELFTRWFQFGSFCPMFRVHGTNFPKEMWRFDSATENILIKFDKLRYHLLPYIYSVSWMVTHESYSMMRGLVMDFQQDPKTYDIPDQYMFGPAIMVNPVTKPTSSANTAVPIPSSQWIDASGETGALTGTYYQGEKFEKEIVSRRDAVISFDWNKDAPDPRMSRNNFSVRWTGSIHTLQAGDYRFSMSADDGMRLSINGKLVIDDWTARPSETKTATVPLPADSNIPVKIEYFQDLNDATVDLKWVPPYNVPKSPTRDVYLPAGNSWVDFWTGKSLGGGHMVQADAAIETMPLFVRAGSIIPYGPDIQYASESVDPMELRVYRGADGRFTLYEDENDNYDYEKGVYATIPFSWSEKNQMLTIGPRKGSFPGMLTKRSFRIVWVSAGHGTGVESTKEPDAEIEYTGQPINIPFQSQAGRR